MDYKEADVICPYYVSSNTYSICCEGFVSAVCRNEFLTRVRERTHFDKYCCGRYHECEYAKRLDKKYE